MPTKILNPNHESSRNLDNMWPQLAIILMRKHGLDTVCITEEDLDRFCEDVAMAVMEDDEGLHLTLMSMEDGHRLAELEGGLPN